MTAFHRRSDRQGLYSQMFGAREFGLTSLIALGIALALELATLVGAPAATPLVLSDWKPVRLVLFFFLSLIPSIYMLLPKEKRFPLRQRLHLNRVVVKRLILNVVITIAMLVFGAGLGWLLALAADNPSDWRYQMICAMFLVMIGLLVVNRHAIVAQLEWGFLVIALISGSMMSALMPVMPESTWDGTIHFNNATALSYIVDAQYSEADVILIPIDGEQAGIFRLGAVAAIEEIPVELDSRRLVFTYPDMRFETVQQEKEILEREEAAQPTTFVSGIERLGGGTYLSIRSFGVIPNAAGLWLGRLLHLGPVERIFLGRMMNVLVYTFLFFFGIRRLKSGKLIVSAIGLAPTTMLIAANYSYDPWNIAFLSFATCYFVGVLQQDEPVEASDSLVMGIAFLLGAIVKGVFFPLVFLFLLIPKERFLSYRSLLFHRVVVTTVAALLLLTFALPFMLELGSNEVVGDVRGGMDVNSGQQIAYVLAHPFHTLLMGLRFAVRMLNPLALGAGVGISDENLLYYSPYIQSTSAPLNEIIAALESLLLLSVSLFDRLAIDERYRKARYKWATLLLSALTFTLIAGALYVSFTDVGRDTISGVQYRYLLPFLAPIMLIVCNTRFAERLNIKFSVFGFLGIELVLMALVFLNSFVIAF